MSVRIVLLAGLSLVLLLVEMSVRPGKASTVITGPATASLPAYQT
jgi:hypothetical protein